MVVMLIMTMLAGIAVPRFVGSLREERLRTASRIVATMVLMARGRAASEARPTRLQFDYDQGTIDVVRLGDAEPGEEAQWEQMPDSLAQQQKLPEAVTLYYVGPDPSMGERMRETELDFRPDGSAEAAYIVLRGYGEAVRVIAVDEIRFKPRVPDIDTVQELSMLEALS
jgi:Tfp pilus assembly protein FimT